MVAVVFEMLRADRRDGGGLQSSLPHPPPERRGPCPRMWASRPEPGAARPRPLAIVCWALVWLRAGGQRRDCGNGLEALLCFPSV